MQVVRGKHRCRVFAGRLRAGWEYVPCPMEPEMHPSPSPSELNSGLTGVHLEANAPRRGPRIHPRLYPHLEIRNPLQADLV